ncbi:MAG TPA: pitrilysin family protein [Pyrinomonadaceae bacterium]|nr:pitrilysin family protein [Pyrinomonadaceae bacterium]
MRMMLLFALLLALPLAAMAQQTRDRKIFPYQYAVDDLPNGLRLITVPTDYPNLVALYIVVSTGSRNEVEPGRSGYAHFFEHLMFRGSKNFSADDRDAILKRAGASSNASTWDDRTIYHEVFAKEDLDKIMEMEADRFMNLQYTQEQYKTEAGAVLGEYNKNSSNPFRKINERLRETAFTKHTYSHTTMGYVKDIEDFPNQYEYSLEFYRRYYRPEYTTIILVGDLTHQRALDLTKKFFGAWERGNYRPDIPQEPEQTEPRTAHVDWPTPTLPHIAVAFKAPAFSTTSKDKVALDLLTPLAFGENSDLYQRLVLKEQKIDILFGGADDQADPELFTVYARVKDPKDVDYVRDEILKTFERHTRELIPQAKLDATRSRFRYGFAMAMNSSEAIANALTSYVALTRDPESLNKVFSMAETVTPEDIRAAAKKYFDERRRTIVTLSTKTGTQTAGGDQR